LTTSVTGINPDFQRFVLGKDEATQFDETKWGLLCLSLLEKEKKKVKAYYSE